MDQKGRSSGSRRRRGGGRRVRRAAVAAAAVLALVLVSVGAGYAVLQGGDGQDDGIGAVAPTRTPTPQAVETPTGTPAPATGTLAPMPPTATPTPVPPSPTPSSGPRDPADLLLVVDKQHGLPADYVPPNLVQVPQRWWSPVRGAHRLRQEAAAALDELLQAAQAAGHEIRVSSAYRSYQEQAQTFQYWVDTVGEEEARRSSAPPGHSEHQLGTTVDLTSAAVGWDLVQSFDQTPEGRWLADHAHQYGFASSYPQGAEAITGYKYEPWHFRYIGRGAAQQWKRSGLVLVRFLQQAGS